MTTDLELWIDNYQHGWEDFYVKTRLVLCRDSKLFKKIKELAFTLVEKETRVYRGGDDDPLYAPVDTYGYPLTWVSAGLLAQVDEGSLLDHDNRAALAYVRAMPPDTSVVLFWC